MRLRKQSQSGALTGKILIVEDERFVRESSCVILREAGFEVFAAGSAAQAKRLCAMQPKQVDLLITDRRLPDSSGEALSIELTHDFPGLKTMFISVGTLVILTSILTLWKTISNVIPLH